jgi:hypothetical protein
MENWMNEVQSKFIHRKFQQILNKFAPFRKRYKRDQLLYVNNQSVMTLTQYFNDI